MHYTSIGRIRNRYAGVELCEEEETGASQQEKKEQTCQEDGFSSEGKIDDCGMSSGDNGFGGGQGRRDGGSRSPRRDSNSRLTWLIYW
jgi:hypothetical protein